MVRWFQIQEVDGEVAYVSIEGDTPLRQYDHISKALVTQERMHRGAIGAEVLYAFRKRENGLMALVSAAQDLSGDLVLGDHFLLIERLARGYRRARAFKAKTAETKKRR